MPFTIPNISTAPYPTQAQVDTGDISILASGAAGTGIQSGGAVSSSGGMGLSIAAGVALISTQYVAFSSASLTLAAADPTNPRIDLISVNTSGTVSATTGTAASTPAYPVLPASSVILAAIYVPPGSSSLSGNNVTDKRVLAYAYARYNVCDAAWGAFGNGTTDDTTAIQSAINAANTAGGGQVLVPGHGQNSPYIISASLILYTNVELVGTGYGNTVIKLANSANCDMIQSYQFNSLTGTNSTGGVYNCGLRDITLDGNKSNNSSGRNLVLYGYGYHVEHVRLRNAAGDGFYSEWSNSSSSPGNDSMEAHIQDVKIHDCGTIGLNFNGPHDSDIVNAEIYHTGKHGVYVGANAVGTNFTQVHCWGMSTGVSALSWFLEGQVNCCNCTAEGSDTAEVVCLVNSCTWTGGAIFGSAIWTNTGWQFGQSAGGTPYYNSVNQSAGLTTAVQTLRTVISGTRFSNCLSTNGTLYFVSQDYSHISCLTDLTGGGKLFSGSTVNAQLFVTTYNGSGASNMPLFRGSGVTAFGNQSSTTLSNSSTITFNDTVFICTSTGNITAVKMNGGTHSGQMVIVKNTGSFTMTFDVQANSKVAGGASVVVQAQSCKFLLWDNSNSLWYPQA